MLTKVRKQGNSLTLTVPSKFKLKEGMSMEPELKAEGIFYRFVPDSTDIFDFDKDILRDLLAENLDPETFLSEFERRKNEIPTMIRQLADQAKKQENAMTREELAKEIGL
ncbi:AbrB family transcriptional regulator [Listeria costaricensis]|uniref:AbrB/MazE/SpoVT family DNA-binding domain-containing protein n=1 Tax=Listeria costaricensis TaxID=2026604 RepID=UPI000C082ADA|nr:AbrB family transcriptional regulator [Listeria costaricensis]